MIADELGFELPEVLESSRTLDQLGIGDGIGRTREEIGQTDLIPHVRRHHDQRRIEQPRHTLEEVTQQGAFRTVGSRDITYCREKLLTALKIARISGLPACLPCLCPGDSARARAAYRNK